MKEVAKWSAGVVAAVLAGLLVYWLTLGLGGGDERDPVNTTIQPTITADPATMPSTDPATNSPTEPQRPLPFVERVRGVWKLQSWTEAGGPITLYIEASNGTLTVAEDGQVDWRMDIDERGENNQPQPAIKCGGQATLAGEIEGVPGGPRNSEINWTSDLHSVDHSSTGEDWIWRALCGWATIGTRAPYKVTLDGVETAPATMMEMANQYGTFRWSRA